ncbi:helix-turn-helix domain-containing protein [Hoeflea poritis]|uniref:Helix-turn-helix domain-containing protein n=1 Tax=Hoeflea poritis TaxID=2993659 RepID=A0ABT4VUP1_9HYPH|nr:helix-turn-helix domain-containing protein [Hoeflea poritis]MDA4848414.1 helix-turn-helix domain-containing protein [Hoeflea poritis]
MSNFFDAEGFYAALDAIRRGKEFSWKKVAEKSNVSASTLTRMGQGKRPDVDSLAALASWSGIDVSQFYRDKAEPRAQKDTIAEITTLLRADRQIEGEDAHTMELMIKTLYEDMRKRRASGP